MKKFLKYFMLTLLVSSFVLAGCKKDDDDPVPVAQTTFEILKDYLVANNMDVDVVINGWIKSAKEVNDEGLSTYHIMDIRSAVDFTAGHIDGAVTSTLATIVADAAGVTKPILVVCYTGQTAGHAVIALRLSGFGDAKVLKFGMAGWTSDPTYSNSWNNNIGDEAANYPTAWAAPTGNITASILFSTLPNLQSTSTDGMVILQERIAALTTGGFRGVDNTTVLADPTKYFINNYWDAVDVETYGNIQPAFRIKPFTLAAGTYMNLDPTQELVTYCWTGQTSSMMTAYLYILGYDSKSLKFGVNGMIYSDLTGHKYTVPTTDYPVVTK